MTSHPSDVDDSLIAAHRDVDILMPFLHLPVQSGADPILAAMNRGHTADEYRRVVGRLRAAQPALVMASDFIVGFPGETDADFEATMSLIRDVEYAQAFSFKYSPRPGTPAATYGAQVPEAVKAQRLADLQALLVEQQYDFNQTCRGTVMRVLFDRSGRDDGRLGGRTSYLQPVQVVAPLERLGSIADVVIDAASPNSLVDRLIEAPRAMDAPAA